MSRGLLCIPCNNAFGRELDSELCSQFAEINGFFGVQNRHKELLVARGLDPSSGETVAYNARGCESSVGLHTISSVPFGQGVIESVLCEKQAMQDDFVRKNRENGIEMKLMGRSKVWRFRPEGIRLNVTLGGQLSFRAMARVALNHFAHYFKDLVRATEMASFISYIRGETSDVFAYYDDFPLDLESPFPVAHKILVAVDGKTGTAFSRMSFFGVLDVGVFYCRFNSPVKSKTVVRDINPLAETIKDGDDIFEQEINADALVPVPRRQHFPEERTTIVAKRMESFIGKLYATTIRKGAEDFAARINEIYRENSNDSEDQIREILKGMGQWGLVSIQEASRYLPARQKAIIQSFIQPDPTHNPGIHPSGVVLIDHLLSFQKILLGDIPKNGEISVEDVMGIFIVQGRHIALHVLRQWFRFGAGAFLV